MATNNVKAGLFVFIGSALLVLFVFIVGGSKSAFSPTYELNVHMKEVQGLNPGSVVQLSGVPVGNVKRIEFNKDGGLIIVLSLNMDHQSKITDTATASLKTQGALGDKYVYISPGEQTGKILKNGDRLSAGNINDLFSTITSKSEQINHLFDIISETRQLLVDLNGKGEIKHIIESLNVTASNLKSFSGDLNQENSGKKLQESIAKLDAILNKIDSGNGSLGAIINDPSLYNKLNQLLGGKSGNPIKSAIRDSIRETEN